MFRRGDIVFVKEGKLRGRKAIVLAINKWLVEVKVIGGSGSLLFNKRDLASGMNYKGGR